MFAKFDVSFWKRKIFVMFAVICLANSLNDIVFTILRVQDISVVCSRYIQSGLKTFRLHVLLIQSGII